MIYLDNAATTFPKPDVVYEALDRANRSAFNAGRGAYNASVEAYGLMEKTRALIGEVLDVSKSSVYFSSSATEALNQIIFGIPFKEGDVVYVSPFEHNAILRPLNLAVETKGILIKVIPFNTETWEFDRDKFRKEVLMNNPRAVFVSQVSNVTGYILPYDEIFNVAKECNSLCILDAAQAFGVIDIDASKIDYVVFAGHKSLYASFGIAGFIKLGLDVLDVYKAGGTGSDSLNLKMAKNGNERYEAGSANIVAIAGLKAALQWRRTVDTYDHIFNLSKYLTSRLREISSVRVIAPDKITPFGVISIIVEGYSSVDVGVILNDEFDIAVRTGFHCAAFAHVFLGTINSGGTVRISLNYFNTEQDVDQLISALETL